MPRIALIVAYDGHDYSGWQYQSEEIPTVQRELQRALTRIANCSIVVRCAGRTDSGVHASKQVACFDTPVVRPDKAWVMGSNTHLPSSISVEWAAEVAPDFDPRYSATARRYIYLVHNHRVRSALMPNYLTREHRPLDIGVMQEAAQFLMGQHDFTSFRAAHCQAQSPVRHVQRVDVRRTGDLVLIDITANAFLQHMVRNITGVLLDVGAGVKPASWVSALLKDRDRTKAGITAPANGLFLVDVQYPDQFGIPAGPRLPHFLQLMMSLD